MDEATDWGIQNHGAISVEYDPIWEDGTILSSRIRGITRIGELWTAIAKKKLVAAGNMDKFGIKSKSVQDNDTNKSIEVTKEGKKKKKKKDEKEKK